MQVEISLIIGSQKLNTSLNGIIYNFNINWRNGNYVLDILDSLNNPIILGIGFATGVDLLAPFRHLNLGFGLYVSIDSNPKGDIAYDSLGLTTHLIAYN